MCVCAGVAIYGRVCVCVCVCVCDTEIDIMEESVSRCDVQFGCVKKIRESK